MTLIEVLIATAILLTFMGAVFLLTGPSQRAFRPQLDVADMHQRLRVAVDTLARDIRMAGAWGGVRLPIDAATEAGGAGPAQAAPPPDTSRRGMSSLVDALAPILPHRIGRRDGEAGVFRPDAISLLSILPTAGRALVRLPEGATMVPAGTGTLRIHPRPYCRPAEPLCGFTPGMRVLLFDGRGAWGLATISALQGDVLQVDHGGTVSGPFAPGAFVAEVAAHTYYLQADSRTGTSQLRHYDGFSSDLPVVDDVVALTFTYFAEAQPPRLLRSGDSEQADAIRTTYGPPPPPPGVDDPLDVWPAGENCLFTSVAGQHVARLGLIGDSGLVALDPALLTDGPWCPDEFSPTRFDADLLRVRRVRVLVRVQVGSASLRGPAGALFARGGTAPSVQRYVPDLEIRFDVTPRNLTVTR